MNSEIINFFLLEYSKAMELFFSLRYTDISTPAMNFSQVSLLTVSKNVFMLYYILLYFVPVLFITARVTAQKNGLKIPCQGTHLFIGFQSYNSSLIYSGLNNGTVILISLFT